MTLEERLREAAERGLTHMSLSATATGWAAIAAPSTAHHYVTKFAKDPIEALHQVLADLPKAPKRRAAKVTATVKPEDGQ
jgi:hypothetical protein